MRHPYIFKRNVYLWSLFEDTRMIIDNMPLPWINNKCNLAQSTSVNKFTKCKNAEVRTVRACIDAEGTSVVYDSNVPARAACLQSHTCCIKRCQIKFTGVNYELHWLFKPDFQHSTGRRGCEWSAVSRHAARKGLCTPVISRPTPTTRQNCFRGCMSSCCITLKPAVLAAAMLIGRLQALTPPTPRCRNGGRLEGQQKRGRAGYLATPPATSVPVLPARTPLCPRRGDSGSKVVPTVDRHHSKHWTPSIDAERVSTQPACFATWTTF